MLFGGRDNQESITNRIPLPVDIVADAAYVNSITGETVQLYYWNSGTLTVDAGQAAGTVVIAKLAYSGVLDTLGGMIGNDKDCSLTWTTNTVLPKASILPCNYHHIQDASNATLEEIATDMTANFSNGQWCIDNRNGIIYGKKATTGTSDTAAYKVLSTSVGGGTTVIASQNLEKINNVDIPLDDAAFTVAASPVIPAGFLADETTTDSVNEGDAGVARITLDRRQINSSEAKDDSAFTAGDYVSQSGFVADEAATDSVDEGDVGIARMTLDRRQIVNINDGTTYTDVLPLTSATVSTGLLSVAGEIVDFDSGAGDDPTPAIGIIGASAGGAKPLYLVADDSEMDATPTMLPVGGEYRATDTTYTEGDATVLQSTIAGHLKVRADGYDTGTDSNKTFEVSPLDQHYVGEKTVLTNIAQSTTAYIYYDMSGYRYITLQGVQNGGASTDTITCTIEASCQDDGTAAASCSYVDITSAFFGVASWLDTDFLAVIDNPTPFKYIRIKYVTNAGGGNDADLTVYSKKMF